MGFAAVAGWWGRTVMLLLCSKAEAVAHAYGHIHTCTYIFPFYPLMGYKILNVVPCSTWYGFGLIYFIQ